MRTLLLIVLLVLLLELGVLVWMVQSIGWAATLGIGVLTALLGGSISRRQRQRVWRDWQAARASGRMPAADAVNPFLVLASGALLIVPGFLTDVVALLLLLPVVRRAVARLLLPVLQRHFDALLRSAGAARKPVPGRNPQAGEVVETEGETVPGSDELREPPQLR